MRALVASTNVLDAVSCKLKNVLHAKVDRQGPAVVRFADVEKRLTQAEVDLLAVVLSPDPERGLDTLKRVRHLTSGYVLAVGHTSEPKLILRALHEGADHYLDEADLEADLEAALSRLRSKREAGSPSARVVALLSASGGCGASTLAVNIAAVLAREHHSCALFDLKLGRGDLGALLDLKPPFTLGDLCLNAARLDRTMFEKLLAPHPSGVHLLAAPQVFSGTRLITPQGVSLAMSTAGQLFPYVVADLEDCFHAEQVLVLRQADVVLLVCRLDFTSLRNARRILDQLQELEIPRERVRLVINRYGQPNELPADEAEDVLAAKIAAYVPDDARTVNGANNTGIPAVLKNPAAKVCQSIVELTKTALERRKNEQAHPARALCSERVTKRQGRRQ